MKIRPITTTDAAEWTRLRHALWPHHTMQQLRAEVDAYFTRQATDEEVFVIDLGQDQLGGFLELSTRNYAEGCKSDRVAYIEGWYVEADLREQGLGGQLVSTAEDWATQQDLTEIASDCLLDNDISLQAHLALGYEEVERQICFRKALPNKP